MQNYIKNYILSKSTLTIISIFFIFGIFFTSDLSISLRKQENNSENFLNNNYDNKDNNDKFIIPQSINEQLNEFENEKFEKQLKKLEKQLELEKQKKLDKELEYQKIIKRIEQKLQDKNGQLKSQQHQKQIEIKQLESLRKKIQLELEKAQKFIEKQNQTIINQKNSIDKIKDNNNKLENKFLAARELIKKPNSTQQSEQSKQIEQTLKIRFAQITLDKPNKFRLLEKVYPENLTVSSVKKQSEFWSKNPLFNFDYPFWNQIFMSKCPLNCSGQPCDVNGFCDCKPGFTGADCSIVGMKPKFRLIGCQKTGTSALMNYLRSHPQVCSARKDDGLRFANFFSDYSQVINWRLLALQENCTLNPIKSEIYIGGGVNDILHSYCPQRAYAFNPKMKLIILLREPISRIWSDYLMRLRILNVTYEPFENIVKLNTIEECFNKITDEEQKFHDCFSLMTIVPRSIYMPQLINWFKYFPYSKDRWLILKSEDLLQNPREIMKKVHKFLEIDNYYYPDSILSQQVNVRLPSQNSLFLESEIKLRLAKLIEPYNKQLYQKFSIKWD
eukprot:TRINITY_DN710_c0_g4_i1.p1 TRINITY_DN710_c0_g4~~TRINITY_DN710_c0_g4_i1.p1  ORF type:complete len:558 (-),score=201.82 TRINITY_DN710_c0_g4_i1:185-1858(-)